MVNCEQVKTCCFQVADKTCHGDPDDASRKILQDFRAGRMGPICLQLAPTSKEDDGQQRVRLGNQVTKEEEQQQREQELEKEGHERAANALKTANQQGLELPPIVENNCEEEVGKGKLDRW